MGDCHRRFFDYPRVVPGSGENHYALNLPRAGPQNPSGHGLTRSSGDGRTTLLLEVNGIERVTQ